MTTLCNPIAKLNSADELLACLREDPNDRVVVDGVVFSLKGIGAASIATARHGFWRDSYGVVATFSAIDGHGELTMPADIKALLLACYSNVANHPLCLGPFEDFYVLAEHPEAEKDV